MRCLMCDAGDAGDTVHCEACAVLVQKAERVAYVVAHEVSSLVTRYSRNPEDYPGAEWVIDQVVAALREWDPLEQRIGQRARRGRMSRRRRLPLRRCACCGVEFASLLSGRDYCERCESDNIDEHRLADNLERERDFRAEAAAERVARGAA